MENKPSMLQHTMSWGAITGIILIVYSLILYLAHQTYNQVLGLLSYILLIAGIIVGSIAYRDKILGGFISYKDAFLAGLLITIFAGILSSFFSFILIRFIDPGVIEQSIAQTEEKLINRGLSEDQIELAMEKSKEFIGSPLMVLVGLLSFAFIGTIISLITAAIVKKESSPFNTGSQSV
jgi:ABC-type multidrug transport system fused ATPase/permease subunit